MKRAAVLAAIVLIPLLSACAQSVAPKDRLRPSPHDGTVLSGNSPYATSRPWVK
jgi:hypothetical protein